MLVSPPPPGWRAHTANRGGIESAQNNGLPGTGQLREGHTERHGMQLASRARIIGLMLASIVLYSSNSVLLILSKGENGSHFPFHLSSVILLAEILRGIGSLLLVARYGKCADIAGIFTPRLILFAVPAVIYAMEDEVAFWCAENMDSGTFQTLSSMKILTTAIIAHKILRHRMTNRQWIALTLLFFGTCLVILSNILQAYSGGQTSAKASAISRPNLPVEIDKPTNIPKTRQYFKRVQGRYDADAIQYYSISSLVWHGMGQKTRPSAAAAVGAMALNNSSNFHSMGMVQTGPSPSSLPPVLDELDQALAEHRFFITTKGAVLVFFYSMLSASASVYSEWLLRGSTSPSTPLWQTSKQAVAPRQVGVKQKEWLGIKMVKIYFWGVIFSLIHSVFEIMYEHERENPHHPRPHLTEGFNFWTYMLVLNQAFLGLVLTAIVSVAGAVTKVFVLPIAMILATLSTITLFHLQSSFMFFIAVTIICFAIILYNHDEQSKSGDESLKILKSFYPYLAVMLYGFVMVGGMLAVMRIHNASSVEKFNLRIRRSPAE